MAPSKKKKNDAVSSDWKKSEDLPVGWMLRVTSGEIFGGKQKTKNSPRTYTYIRSPNGRTFFGRKQALQFMLERGHSTAEVEKMREGLVHEGWNDHQLLPKGWKVRGKRQEARAEFLTEEAEVINNEKNAIKFIRANCSAETQENFKTFVENNTKKRRLSNYDFHDDKSLPKGWKSRGDIKLGKPGAGFYLLSPTNEQFAARRVALRFATENNFAIFHTFFYQTILSVVTFFAWLIN